MSANLRSDGNKKERLNNEAENYTGGARHEENKRDQTGKSTQNAKAWAGSG
jgi:hypothetical protein